MEQFLWEKIKVNEKTGNLGNAVLNEGLKNKITVVSKKQFSKRHLKYLTKKCLRRILASDKETMTFIISRSAKMKLGERLRTIWPLFFNKMQVCYRKKPKNRLQLSVNQNHCTLKKF